MTTVTNAVMVTVTVTVIQAKLYAPACCSLQLAKLSFSFLAQAVPSSPSSSPVTPRVTSSFKSLVGRVKGVGLGGLEPAEMQSPNKTKYSRSESHGAGLRTGDHPVGEHAHVHLPVTNSPSFQHVWHSVPVGALRRRKGVKLQHELRLHTL